MQPRKGRDFIMKKPLLYLCTGILALGLTACGGSPEESGESGNNVSQGTEQTENSGGSEEISNSGEGNGENSGAGDSQQEAGGNPEDEFTGEWSEEMAGLRAAVVEAVGEENYWPNMPMDPEMLQFKLQLTSDVYEDYMAESPMIGAHVDTLIIVKAKEGQADTVYDLMNAYREGLISDTMQYPMNLGKIQASMLEKTGDYVIFVQLGGETPDEEEAAITQCQEANGKALEAIRNKLGQ